MVNVLENVFSVSDIWEMFCFVWRLPEPSECLGGTEALEGTPACTGAITVTPEQDLGPAQHWVSEWARPQGHLWQLSRGTRSPAPARKAKPAWKKPQDNHSKLWNSAPACSYEEAGGFLCSSTSLYFIKRNLLSILDWSYRKLLINSLPQKGSSLNPK